MRANTPDDENVPDVIGTLLSTNMVEDCCAPIPPGFPNQISVAYELKGDEVHPFPLTEFVRCTDDYKAAIRAEVVRQGWTLVE